MGIDSKKKAEYLEEVVPEVLRNFWPAILANKLTVTVNSAKNKTVAVLNKDSLDDYMTETFKDKPYDDTNPYPFYDTVINQGAGEEYLCVPADLEYLGPVKLYIKKEKGAKDLLSYYRSLHMIVNTKPQRFGYEFYAVFECVNEKGDLELQRMENPEHSEWSAKEYKDENRERNPKKGKAIEDVIKNFVQDKLREIFRGQQTKKASLVGFSKYMGIPEENGQPDDDGPFNPFSGSCKLVKAGFPTTSRLGKKPRPVTKKERQNAMAVIQAEVTEDETGDLSGGRTSDKHVTPAPDPVIRPGKKPHKEDPEGEQGVLVKRVGVSCRVIAQPREDGYAGYVHICKINNPGEDIENCRLMFISEGEQKNENTDIQSASEGEIRGNTLTDLRLNKGTNVIEITFADDFKHSLKLDTYEVL